MPNFQIYFMLWTIFISGGHGFEITDNYQFDREYFGVCFSPYVRNYEGNSTKKPDWGKYTFNDVKVLVKVTAKRFGNIATYSAGTSGNNVNNGSWVNGDGNAWTARAAAQINREAGKQLITMAQGIYQSADSKFQDKETQYGLDEIEDANRIFPGTVTRLIVYNSYVSDDVNGQLTLHAIKNLKPSAQALNVKIGTTIKTCDQINGGDIDYIIKELAMVADFLLCGWHPDGQKFAESPEEAVTDIGKKYWTYTKSFKALNPKLEILIGDSGWPSSGVSFSGTHNTLTNLRDFWESFNEWAIENKVSIYLFEAFDEPWKSQLLKTDPKDAGGKYGGERHYGWFKLANDSNNNIVEENIVEKVPHHTEKKSKEDPAETIWIWIVVALMIVLLLCGIIFALFYRQYKKTYMDQLAEADIEEFERGIPEAAADGADRPDLAWNFPYNRDYEIPKDKLIIEQSKVLGSGEFGVVYKGKAVLKEPGSQTVDAAIKTTKPRSSAVTLKSLLSEIKTMIYLGKHTNVVQFIGSCTSELRDGIVYIVMEFCTGGSLENHLRNIRTSQQEQEQGGYENLKPLPSNYSNVTFNETNNEKNENKETVLPKPKTLHPKLSKWAYEIASGMEFLASKNVIHADLATRNILLTSNETAKITDFGLSRRLYEYTEYVKKNQEPLPWRWMSPESLHSMTFSSQSDVWSYGITLWEIFSLGDIPYPGLSWTINFVDQLFAGMKLTTPKLASSEIYQIMLLCWEIKPENRPSFRILRESFHASPEETSL